MDINALERMIEAGRDSAMLRLTLARLLTGEDRNAEAADHLDAAVKLDPGYTAAWKELGKVRLVLGEEAAAEAAWTKGSEVAVTNGDKQAEKEMGVFLRRLRKARDG